MDSQEYLKTLTAVEQETEQLLKDRSRIDERLMQLKTTADALRALLGMKEFDNSVFITELGITEAIRQVLANSKTPLSAPEIMREVGNLTRADLSAQYANPGAVIHNTLTRLEKQREVVRVQNPAGQTAAYALVKNSFYKRLSEA